MVTRQNIKAEEERIRTLIAEKGDEETAARRAWNRMMDYFSTNDYLERNNHVAIIKYIYLTRYYKGETLYCKANKNFIGERTLYRYRKKYVSCFRRYYLQEQKK